MGTVILCVKAAEEAKRFTCFPVTPYGHKSIPSSISPWVLLYSVSFCSARSDVNQSDLQLSTLACVCVCVNRRQITFNPPN